MAVVGELRQEHVDKILCVGDIVGYAAEPAMCIDLVRELNCTVVAGNHDYAVVEKFPADYFHADARDAIVWTARQLSNGRLEFLKKMPLVEELDDITLVHGSLNRPEFFDYIRTVVDARLSFDLLKTPICFYGHTHIPLAIYLKKGNIHVMLFLLCHVELHLVRTSLFSPVGIIYDWDIRAS